MKKSEDLLLVNFVNTFNLLTLAFYWLYLEPIIDWHSLSKSSEFLNFLIKIITKALRRLYLYLINLSSVEIELSVKCLSLFVSKLKLKTLSETVKFYLTWLARGTRPTVHRDTTISRNISPSNIIDKVKDDVENRKYLNKYHFPHPDKVDRHYYRGVG